jgi:hypothetical protein
MDHLSLIAMDATCRCCRTRSKTRSHDPVELRASAKDGYTTIGVEETGSERRCCP